MSDYFNVPKAANYIDDDDTTPNEQFYSKGITLFDYDNYNHYKIAYASVNSYEIRVGVVRNSPEHYTFVLVSPLQSVANVDIRLISPYITMVGRVENILNKIPDGYDGYFNIMQFSKDRMTFHNINIFDDVDTCAKALSGGEEPQPGDGVVVTCIGTPLAPDTNGVIVYCTGQLLDPNQQGGTSDPGGGTGTFDDTSDLIPISPLPELSAANVGLVTLFRPSEIQLRSLGSYLWTNITDFIENLNKLFINPMDYMIALNIFPCNPNVGDERPIKIGSFSTTISMPPVLSQWYEHNCGTLVTNEYWGSALDYAPNTKISLMLPFIGNVQLNPDEIMGKRLGIKYRIDLLSGQCVALISVDDSILYQFTGECSVSVPLTGSDWSRIYSAVVGAIGTAITTGVSTGGIIDVAKTTGRAATAGDRIRRANSIAAGRITGGVANTVNQVMNGKGGINHSGSISGSAGMLGMRYPYLMIEFPNQSLADNYRHFVGYPSNMSSKLGDLKGYTEVEQVIPEGFWGTDDELAELVEALKGGVYL